MVYRVLYFASLRDKAGCDEERIHSDASDTQALYAQLQRKHEFSLPQARLRVAVNGDFASWDRALDDGDEVVFLPPVSGG